MDEIGPHHFFGKIIFLTFYHLFLGIFSPVPIVG